MPAIEYKVQTPTGEVDTWDDDHLLGQLQAGGFNPIDRSPDGTMFTLQDEQGTYQVTAKDALEHLGFQVQGEIPLAGNAQFGSEDPMLRAAVLKLPSQEAKIQYLEQYLMNNGIDNPMVKGEGRDFYAFSPQAGKWLSLTNNPDWDRTDIAEAAVSAPEFLGSVAGGVIGSVGGPAGFIAGSGIGAAAGETATRLGLAAIDPMYASVAEEDFGGQAKEVIQSGIYGAGAALLPMGVAKAVKPLAGLMQRGAISPAVKATGGFLESAGKVLAPTAKAIDTPTGRAVTSMGIPVAGEAQALGFMAQAPEFLVSKMPQWTGNLAKSPFVQKYSPATAEYMGKVSQKLSTPVAPRASEAAAEAISLPGTAQAQRVGASGPLGEMFAAAGRRFAPAKEETLRRAGQTVGRGMENLATVGRGIEKASEIPAHMLLKGTQATGRGLQYAGQGIRNIGTLTSPLESRAGFRYGIMEPFDKYLEDQLANRQKDKLRRDLQLTTAGVY